jgi:surface protein
MFYGCGNLTSLDLSKWNVENVTKVAHMFSDCYKLESIDLTGWNTKSLTCMDAMFDHCTSLKVIDMSNFTTDKVKEFSQLFEACWSLEKIIGLEKWNTQSGQDFSEMFNQCYALKELDLSTFVTVQSDRAYITYYPWTNNMFHSFLSGCNSLEKITFGPSFSFDGNGTAPADCVCKIPAATNVEGWDGKWYTADGTGYLPSEIPEETAATYYAVKPVNP